MIPNELVITKAEEGNVKWIEDAANQGNPLAQWKYGDWCEYGDYGITKSLNEAFKWYIKSANQGYAPAQFAVGECYYNGQVTPQMEAESNITDIKNSFGKALYWFKKAAGQGYADAQMRLPDTQLRYGTFLYENYLQEVITESKPEDKRLEDACKLITTAFDSNKLSANNQSVAKEILSQIYERLKTAP